jgi:hypothetical protein
MSDEALLVMKFCVICSTFCGLAIVATFLKPRGHFVPRFTNFVNSVVTNLARSIGRAALCFFCSEQTSSPTSSLETTTGDWAKAVADGSNVAAESAATPKHQFNDFITTSFLKTNDGTGQTRRAVPETVVVLPPLLWAKLRKGD